jgi:hypothetical protein
VFQCPALHLAFFSFFFINKLKDKKMFLTNKYSKCYFNIINNAKARSNDPSIYVEKHHIVPKSLGGSNDMENLVILTAREHFICHLLLTKMVAGENKTKMIHAAWRMTVKGRSDQLRHKCSARTYEQLKKDRSAYLKSLVGELNPNFGRKTGRTSADFTSEWKEKLSLAAVGRTPWNKGIPRNDKVKDAVSKANKGKIPWNKGKERTPEEKLKIKEANSGKKWIYNPKIPGERKQLDPYECDFYISLGWIFGFGPRKKRIT